MILETVLRNVLADAIDDEVNTGAGTAQLLFETAGDVEVATIDLANPAFGAAAAGVITLAGVTLSDADATGGTAAQVSMYDRDGTKQAEFTLGTAATEFIISNTTIGAGDQVDVTGFTITVPAS